MKNIIASSLLLAASSAFAEGTTLIEWEPPTEYVDGTPLYSEEIFSYSIKYGTASGSYSYTIPISASETTKSLVLPNGTWYIAMTVTTVDMQTSDFSNEVTRKISGGKPKAPRIK